MDYPINIYNNSAQSMPGFSIAQIKVDANEQKPNNQRFVVVERPTGSDATGYVLTSPVAVENGKSGHGQSVYIGGWVNYSDEEEDEETPTPGVTVGPTENSWKVSTLGEKFVVFAVNTSDKLVWIQRDMTQCDTAHEFTIEGNPTAGTFTWRYQINSTNDDLEFNFDSTAAQAQAVFEGHTELSTGDVEVTGGPLPHVALYVEFDDNVEVTATPSLVANTLTQEESDPFDPQPKLRLRA